MVRSKGRFGFIQYIRDKPTKWGFKLWVLADSTNAYTYDFDVYVGRRTTSSKFGLGYDVVMELCKDLQFQGYKLYFDNFYTSTQLLKDLKKKGIFAVGTVRPNRKGFPKELKETMKKWDKESERGELRWVRDEDVVVIQWKDNRVVSVMSSFHSGSHHTTTRRNTRKNGRHEVLQIKQPFAIHDYNQYMGGVDRSDQLIGTYNILRKTNKYWKTLFFHLVDIAVVNSYILFTEMQKKHPGNIALQRPSSYGQRQFREELLMQLGSIEKDAPVPLYKPSVSASPEPTVSSDKPLPTHLPRACPEGERRSCKVCSIALGKNAYKSTMKCLVCNHYLCCSDKRECFYLFHTDPKYEKFRK